MKLTVLNVAYPLARVTEDSSGGAEQVLAMLDQWLTREGHRSIVVAPDGSRCHGRLVPVPAYDGVLDEQTRSDARRECARAINRVLGMSDVDLVHLHGVDCFDYLPGPDVPTVITLHLPPSWYPSELFELSRSEVDVVCVSESQRRACPAASRIAAVIDNGIQLDRFPAAGNKENYVAALGRICPEKGFHIAMDAASVSGCQLVLAGALYEYPAHREYFEREIRPRLSRGHRYVGPVAGREKLKLLSSARCLLVPSLVPETSSLVAMEAMACGTPVIAFRAGALSEIVSDGRTGFLVDSVEQMAEAIDRAGECSPAECHREAERRFGSERMCRGYFELYEQVASDRRRRPVYEVRA